MATVRPAASDESARQQAYQMERAMLDIRRHWFGSREVQLGCAVVLHEPGGELVSLVDGPTSEVDQLLADAGERGCYVVVTDFSQPHDLGARLRRRGFRSIQRHGTYLFDPQAPQALDVARSARSLIARFMRGPAPAVDLRPISEGEMPVWNEVCWRSFGMQGTQEKAFQEKQNAFRSMGDQGTWLLAELAGRPAGVACLFQGVGAAQVLAVGTLPAYRRRGVATAVVRALIGPWAEGRSGSLFLDTRPGSSAERLYMRLGFRPAYIRVLYAPQRT